MFPWLEDDDCTTVQACGLTSYVQLQEANSFILKILKRHILLPNPTDTEQYAETLKWQPSTIMPLMILFCITTWGPSHIVRSSDSTCFVAWPIPASKSPFTLTYIAGLVQDHKPDSYIPGLLNFSLPLLLQKIECLWHKSFNRHHGLKSPKKNQC